jgi:dienelactone hydrolase
MGPPRLMGGRRRIFSGALVTIAIVALAAGCAVQETPQQRAGRIEPMLAAAGFHMLPADTPARIAETQRLTPLKVRYYIENGKPHYWFNDPVDCHCVYVGSEKNYQQYEQIRLTQQAAQREAEAAEMNQEAAEQEQMNMTLWPGPFIMY